MPKDPTAKYHNSQQAVLDILQKHKLIADLVHKQNMPHHDLVEVLVRKENMAQLQQILNHLPAVEIARILEELPLEDQMLIWERLDDDHKQHILLDAPISVLQILGKQDYKTEKSRVKAFGLVIIGWLTFAMLRFLENREYAKSGKLQEPVRE